MKKRNPLELLISEGEHQQQDFKFEVSDSRKIARTLSAFANTDGGRLLIGVKDNGNISGVKGDEEYYMIEAASKMYTRPEVRFDAQTWNVDGKTVLQINVAQGDEPPYMAPDKNGIYKAFIRVKDENILANAVLVKGWIKQQNEFGRVIKLSKPVELLFDYLKEHEYISMRKFCKIAHLKNATALNILSDLFAVGVLSYVVKEKNIYYAKGEDVSLLSSESTYI